MGSTTGPPGGYARLAALPFAPAVWAMNHLRVAWKLAVVAGVLLVPVGLIARNYVDARNEAIAMAENERAGGRYLDGALALLDELVTARTSLATGQPYDQDAVETAVDALADTDALDGKALQTADALAAVRDAVDAAQSSSSEASWQAAIDATTALIVHVGDRSQLILDPDLDSYYLMDVALIRVPILLETLGQLEASAANPDPVDRAVDQSTVVTTVETISGELATSYSETADATLEPAVRPLEDDLVAAVDALGQQDGAAATAASARDAAVELADGVLPALDQLLDERAEGFAAERNGALRQLVVGLVVGLYLFAGAVIGITRSTRRVARGMAAAAGGDFSAFTPPAGRDELSATGRSFAAVVGQLRDALREVHRRADVLTSSASTLEATSEELSGAADATHHRAVAMAGVTEEMNASIGEIGRTVAATSEETSTAADVVAGATASIERLYQRSAEIEGVVELISSIAQQTNLLALNATIEASRAGEHGRGFAVVASEVKKLANETELATDRVSSILSAIRHDTEEAVGKLGAISAAIETAGTGQATIGSAVDQQTSATGEISRAAASMADAAAVAQASTARIRALATDVAATGDELSHVVGRFRFGV